MKSIQSTYFVTISNCGTDLKETIMFSNRLKMEILRLCGYNKKPGVGIIVVSQNNPKSGCIKILKKGKKSFDFKRNNPSPVAPHIHMIIMAEGTNSRCSQIKTYCQKIFRGCSVNIEKCNSESSIHKTLSYSIEQHYKYRAFETCDADKLEGALSFMKTVNQLIAKTGSYRKPFGKSIRQMTDCSISVYALRKLCFFLL